MQLKPPAIYAMANATNYHNFDTPKGKRKFRKFLDEVEANGWKMWEVDGKVHFEPSPFGEGYLTKDSLKCPDCEKTDRFRLHCEGLFDVVVEAGKEDRVEVVNIYKTEEVSCDNCQCTDYIETFRT